MPFGLNLVFGENNMRECNIRISENRTKGEWRRQQRFPFSTFTARIDEFVAKNLCIQVITMDRFECVRIVEWKLIARRTNFDRTENCNFHFVSLKEIVRSTAIIRRASN